MPGYLTTTIAKRRKLFALAIFIGGGVAVGVGMLINLRRVPDPFAQDYSDAERATHVERGAVVFAKHNCAECHATTTLQANTSGAAFKGPSLVGIVGQPVTLIDGTTRDRDHRYLRRAIRNAGKDRVAGYAFALMPDYSFLEDDDVDALLLYVRSLGD